MKAQVCNRQNRLGINILMYFKVEITKVFSSKMVDIYKPVVIIFCPSKMTIAHRKRRVAS